MNGADRVTTSKRTLIARGIGALAALTCISAGYVSGTVDGDIPWTATAVEESTYNVSTALTAVTGVLVFLALATWALAKRPKVGKAVLVILVSLGITALIFFASYAVGAL